MLNHLKNKINTKRGGEKRTRNSIVKKKGIHKMEPGLHSYPILSVILPSFDRKVYLNPLNLLLIIKQLLKISSLEMEICLTLAHTRWKLTMFQLFVKQIHTILL